MIALVTLLLAAAPAAPSPASAPSAPATSRSPADAYRQEIEQWRAERETRLKSETGWLSVSGLFWLKPGANRFGRDADNDIPLPDGPAAAGAVVLDGDRVLVRPAAGTTMEMDGQSVTKETALPLDDESLRLGRLSLQAIRRGDRYGLRVRDPESALRKEFHGLDWFPVDPALRLEGRFIPDKEPQTVAVTNVLGQTTPEKSPGVVELKIGGQTVRLRPIFEDGDTRQWFYIFRDATAPKLTYGGGRFLYSTPAEDGRVVVDFNKAYNPPCAFNPYTTCPLPPPENLLAVEVPAGEKKYRK